MNPLVSVCMPTYNQERYIRKSIEGVLSQEIDFQIELLIGEDESNDGTREICQEYASNYPQLIKLFFGKRKDVIHIQGRVTGRANFMRLLSAAQGKYIAICEGDDYWLNPHKLERQVNFLEDNADYSSCFHDVMTVDENDSILRKGAYTPQETGDYALSNFFYRNKTATCSKVFRANSIVPPPQANHVLPYDWLLSIYAGERGKIFYFNDIWAAYRVHSAGLWQQMNSIEMDKAGELALKQFDSFFEYKYSSWIRRGLINRRRKLARKYMKERKFSKAFWARVKAESQAICELNKQ